MDKSEQTRTSDSRERPAMIDSEGKVIRLRDGEGERIRRGRKDMSKRKAVSDGGLLYVLIASMQRQ